ncbi:ClpX C4-type zinc finger protein [Burkholderia multivorans]|nr:ClpX C4-type zinc finger protein [Burkholderia multivorans]
MSKKWTCDFCNRTEDEVAHIVVTPSEVAICDECVATCNELIAEASRPSDVKVKVHDEAARINAFGRLAR